MSHASFVEIIKKIEFAEKSESEKSDVYPPDYDDLYLLYSTVRKECVISVLEIGAGWSTFALTLGVLENKSWLVEKYQLKNPNPFSVMSVDASQNYMQIAIARLSNSQKEIFRPVVSTPVLQEFNGKIVSLFDNIPFYIPDLVYLDGPDTDQCLGSVAGLVFDKNYSFPMAADLVRIENHLLPNTLIITDGRRANARYLESMFLRNWQVYYDPFGDHTFFRLEETPLGKLNESHFKFRVDSARLLREKK